MLFDVLIVVLCIYLSYTNINMLAGVPLGAWQVEQWLLAAVTLALMVVGVYKATRVVKAFFAAQHRAQDEAKKLRAQGEAERRAQEEAGIDGDDEADEDEADGEDE